MSDAIRTENLVKRFGKLEALRGLNLTVEQGAVYALVGPNGAGKTTAIKILMNIYGATFGSAEVLGIPSTRLRGHHFASIGYVSENQDLPEWMTVAGLFSFLRPFYPSWDRKLEEDLVRQLNLPLDRKLRHLSRGMRMKTLLGSALAYRPKLIVLDEPFSGLDPLVRDELIQSLLECVAESTVLISSHDLAEIESFASHVGYLEDGQLRFSEELTALVDRFREVELTFDVTPPLPTMTSGSWMHLDASSAVVHFVETRFHPEETAAEIQNVFRDVRHITFAPMSLRSIFLAIARGQVKQSGAD
jgi:ABC-2 type transport system ATP-binding protein